MSGGSTAVDAGRERARTRRVVDLWYVLCVMVPLLLCISSPAWYVELTHPRGATLGAAVGLLAAGWIPWLMTLMGTAALADRYEVTRHPRGATQADAWDRFTVRVLIATGAIGVVLTLLCAGLVLSVAAS